MKAALLASPASPLVMADVDCVDPGPGQVRVQVTHCGLCHSDLTMIDAPEMMTPIILGHEAAGIVDAVGPGVGTLAPGDHVMLSPFGPCGTCYWCVRGETTLCAAASSMFMGTMPDGSIPFSMDGQPVYRGLGVAGFGELTMVAESAAVKIDPDVPLEVAAVIGCAIQTGVGAVLNTAKVEEGATVLVMGLGGVGMSVVQGARLAGASRIFASDPVADRRNAAVAFGATDLLDPNETDVVAHVQEATSGIGVDYAFDAAGAGPLVEAGLAATRNGGTTVMVGAPALEHTVTINPAVMYLTAEKKLLGCLFGGCNSQREVPRLLALWQNGRLDLEPMITARRPIDEINAGLDDLRASIGIRTVFNLS